MRERIQRLKESVDLKATLDEIRIELILDRRLKEMKKLARTDSIGDSDFRKEKK